MPSHSNVPLHPSSICCLSLAAAFSRSSVLRPLPLGAHKAIQAQIVIVPVLFSSLVVIVTRASSPVGSISLRGLFPNMCVLVPSYSVSDDTAGPIRVGSSVRRRSVSREACDFDNSAAQVIPVLRPPIRRCAQPSSWVRRKLDSTQPVQDSTREDREVSWGVLPVFGRRRPDRPAKPVVGVSVSKPAGVIQLLDDIGGVRERRWIGDG